MDAVIMAYLKARLESISQQAAKVQHDANNALEILQMNTESDMRAIEAAKTKKGKVGVVWYGQHKEAAERL